MELPLLDRPLTTELTRAIHDVLTGTPAFDAWLHYVKARHGGALGALGHLTLGELRLDPRGQAGRVEDDAVLEQEQLIDSVARQLSRSVWRDIREVRSMLEEVEALTATPEESNVLVLADE